MSNQASDRSGEKPADSKEPAKPKGKTGGKGHTLSPLWWVLFTTVKILTLPFFPVRNRVAKDGNIVWVTGHDRLIYTWFIPVVGLAIVLLQSQGWLSDIISGWIAVGVFFLFLFVYAKDVGLTGAAVIGLILALFLTSAELIHMKLDIPVLGEILEFFQDLKPEVGVGFWKALAVIPTIYIAVYCLPWSFLNGRHELSSRSVELMLLGRKSVMTAAAGLCLEVQWPDLFEFFLGLGAGSLVFRDRTGKVVKRIDNVIGLYFLYPFIEPLYQSTATTEDHREVDAAALEELS